jgi:hypothetical protein
MWIRQPPSTAMNDPIFNLPGSNAATYLWHTAKPRRVSPPIFRQLLCHGALGTFVQPGLYKALTLKTKGTIVQPGYINTRIPLINNGWPGVFMGLGTFTYEWSTGDTTDIIQLNKNEFACVTVISLDEAVPVGYFLQSCKPYISETYFSNNNILLTASGIYDPSQGATYEWSTAKPLCPLQLA